MDRSDWRGHHDAESALFPDRQHGGLRGGARRETIVHQQHGLACERWGAPGMKSGLVTAQPLLLLFNNRFQLCSDHWVRPNDILVKDGHAVLRQRADRKLTMPGMSDLADEEHVQRQV